MKITVQDQRDPSENKRTEHDVIVTVDDPRYFGFKCPDLPPPALGRKYFHGGKEVDVTEKRMEVEDGKAMFHYSAKYLPQP